MPKQVSVRRGRANIPQQQGPRNLRRRDSVDLAQVTSLSALQTISRFDAIVGSSDQVASNLASHASISDALSVGQSILILPGCYSGNITVSKNNMYIFGMGNATVLSGTVTITGSNCVLKTFRCGKGFFISGNYNVIKEIWTPKTASLTDTGVDNVYEIIQELECL